MFFRKRNLSRSHCRHGWTKTAAAFRLFVLGVFTKERIGLKFYFTISVGLFSPLLPYLIIILKCVRQLLALLLLMRTLRFSVDKRRLLSQ